MTQLWHLPVLFVTALVAGFVDSIAGGGGLITLPALLSCGLSPRHAPVSYTHLTLPTIYSV